MASVSSFTFDNLTRLGEDTCAMSERDIQNNSFGTYTTNNYFLQYCGMKQPIQFATKQPNIFFKGGFGPGGAGGCVIDDNSDLMIGSIQTNPKCRISLQQRPFITVPYLGRGAGNPVAEAKLQQGAHVNNKKSCNTVTETPFERETLRLVPSLRATIQNPNNLVEGVAAKGWIRGGLPTRELNRDQDYFQRHKPSNGN